MVKPAALLAGLPAHPVLAGPIALGADLRTAQYREALTRGLGWQVASLDAETVVEAARIRAAYRLRLPDAIQVATAIRVGAAALVTHDKASDVGAFDIAIADLNGDGASDLAVANTATGSARLELMYQDPALRGSFRPAVALTVPGTATTGVAAGDLDGDGRSDLAMTIALPRDGYTPNSVMGISLQLPDGTMGPVVTMAPQRGLNVTRMKVADYDGDGQNDLFAYFTPFSTDYTAKLMVMLQGPVRGQFSAPVDTPMRDLKGIDDAVIADLDGDLRPDAAVAGFFPVGSPSVVHARVNRFTQSGAGAFALVSSADLSIDASRVTAGDVDGDGRNEVVVLGQDDRFLVLD